MLNLKVTLSNIIDMLKKRIALDSNKRMRKYYDL